ncbi:MAG TPA: 3'-5' exonuclease, partial [Rhodocyclaceae bacterium]|nr:3'-5' exonuclease [Rhodocyclaceae bacterium]
MSEATFAVVDTETTGLSPAHHHRIIEIAVVELDREGNELGHWTTLVNPERDVGASDIHGISPADLFEAPIFSGIAADLAQRLQGRILVAHNLPFDLDFLVSEYLRLGVLVPLSRSMGLCTMRLAGQYLPWAGRSLAACTEAVGGSIETAHAALHDARAAAGILRHLLAQGPGMEQLWQPVLEAVRLLSWPTLDLSPRPLRPRTAGCARPQVHFLSRLVSRMPRETILPAADSYLALVDRVLLDRFISKHEEKELVSLAETLGLSREEALQCH